MSTAEEREKKKLSALRICAQSYTSKAQNAIKKMKLQGLSSRQQTKMMAAFKTAALWPPNSVITVAFVSEPEGVERTQYGGEDLGKLDPLQKELQNAPIKDAVKRIVSERLQPIVGVTIKFIDDPKSALIRISFNSSDGAWSLLGTECKQEKTEPTMNLGWFDVATTMHEFGHALGLIHEHQNPRGNAIAWDEQKVYKWAASTQGWDKQTTYTNIIERTNISEINGSEYDPDSIMLYFFPAELTTNNKGTKENLRLSGYDVEYLANTYPGGREKPVQYYKRVYNQDIQESKIQSDNRRKFQMENSININSISEFFRKFKIPIIIVLSLAIIYIIYKKRKSSQ